MFVMKLSVPQKPMLFHQMDSIHWNRDKRAVALQRGLMHANRANSILNTLRVYSGI